MKIAIIGDIHSNLVALEAVLNDAQEQGVDLICCLGDVIGYLNYPQECFEALETIDKPVYYISGNHERIMYQHERQKRLMGVVALATMEFNEANVGSAFYSQIQTWPNLITLSPGVAISHDTLTNPGNDCYVVNEPIDENDEACASQLRFMPPGTRIAFLGHTHTPYLFGQHEGELNSRYQEQFGDEIIELSGDACYLINPGSVGQPRDGDPRAAYGIFQIDRGRQSFCLRRVEYDIASAVSGIARMGLSEEIRQRLSRRLFKGR